jgi:hypothetical protein
MRKIVLLSLALVATLAAAASSPRLAEAVSCTNPTYRCICSVPYKCCGTTCMPDPDGPFQCTQVYNC